MIYSKAVERGVISIQPAGGKMLDVLKVIVWPILILIVCLIFRSPIISLLTNSQNQNTTIEIGLKGLSITKVAAAAAAITVDSINRADKENPLDQKALVANITQGIEVSLSKSVNIDGGRLLWVDDNPANNFSLITAFNNVGITVTKSLSTSEAEQELKSKKFDLIVTDMSRPPDNEAGLTLLKYLKSNNIETPVIIFAAYWASQHLGQEKTIGVSLVTNETSKVYSTVLRKLLTSKETH